MEAKFAHPQPPNLPPPEAAAAAAAGDTVFDVNTERQKG